MTTAEIAAVISQAIIAAVILASIASNIFRGSPSASLFQSINLMQLYMLLILLRVYLPKRVVDYILLNDIFNFNFAAPTFIPVLGYFLAMFEIGHSDGTLHDLDVESLSTVYSLSAHLLILALIGITHLAIWAVKLLWPKRKSESMAMRLGFWISKKIWSFFTFTVYIRTILQVSQLWIIVSFSEIYESNFSSIASAFSFVFAFMTLCGIIAFSSFNVALGLNSSGLAKKGFQEYFSSIKNKKIAKMYNVVIMVRRLILVSLMACLVTIDKVYLVVLAVIYQVLHTIIIGWIRPYESIRDNINEVMIDVVFSVSLISLIHFNTKDAWNEVVATAYFYLLNFPGVFILISFLGRSCQ